MPEHSIAVAAAAAAASEESASGHGHHSRYGRVSTAAGCRKGGNKNLYAVDEDENENIEESVEDEDDLQAWCLLEESEIEQWQEVINRRSKKRVKRANQSSLLSVENSQNVSSKKVVETKDRWMKVRVTMDTGAAGHVMPEAMFPNVKLERKTPPMKFVTANGDQIRDFSEKNIPFRTNEGIQRCITFRSANVVKPLISMQKIVRAGNVVVLDEKNPHIRNIRDGTVKKLDANNGVYTMDLSGRDRAGFQLAGTVSGQTAFDKPVRPAKSCKSEAELYAAALGASELKGIISLMRDVGYEKKPVLAIDAKATEHILHRQGIGKLKHIDVAYLWIQGKVRSRRLQVRRVKSEDNIADLGTKPLSKAVMAKHCTIMGYMNMSQENAQMGHQSWGCIETLDQYAAGDHVQKAGGSEPQQLKHPQQRQQAGQEPRPIAKSGSRSQNMTRTRGQDGVQARGLPDEGAQKRLQGERRGQQPGYRLDDPQSSSSPATRSPTWRPTTSPSSGRHGERTPR